MDNNVIIRHARNAVDMVINGAVRQIEKQYADGDPACNVAITELLQHVREEVDSWESPE